MGFFATTILTRLSRLGHTIYGMLQQQQNLLNKIERDGSTTSNMPSISIVNQSNPQPWPLLVEARSSEVRPPPKQSSQMISKPTKSLPWTVQFEGLGVSGQVVALPNDKGKRYQAAVHVSFFGKMYTIQIRLPWTDFTFDRILHVRNIVPIDCEMTNACRRGDFDTARKLLSGGAAHGSDVSVGGWPMLDVSDRCIRLKTGKANDDGSMP